MFQRPCPKLIAASFTFPDTALFLELPCAPLLPLECSTRRGEAFCVAGMNLEYMSDLPYYRKDLEVSGTRLPCANGVWQNCQTMAPTRFRIACFVLSMHKAGPSLLKRNLCWCSLCAPQLCTAGVYALLCASAVYSRCFCSLCASALYSRELQLDANEPPSDGWYIFNFTVAQINKLNCTPPQADQPMRACIRISHLCMHAQCCVKWIECKHVQFWEFNLPGELGLMDAFPISIRTANCPHLA